MSFDIGGFVNYWTGNFGGSGSSGGSSAGSTVSLPSSGGFSNGDQLFSNLENWNSLSTNVTNPTWVPESNSNVEVPAITRLGNWPTAAGLGGAARDSLLDSAMHTTVEVGVTSYSHKDFGLSEADVADLAFNSFNRAFRSLTDGGTLTGMHEFGNVLGSILSGEQNFTPNDLITKSNEVVNGLANMGDEDIARVVSDFRAGLRTNAKLTEANEGGFDSYADATVSSARPKLIMIRNAARSLVELRGRDENFVSDPRVAGETYTQFGANLNKGEKLRNIVISMGIYPASADAQGAGGASTAGGPAVTPSAPVGVGKLLLDGLKEDYKITNLDPRLFELYTGDATGKLAYWVSKIDSVRSAILDPNMDSGTAATDGAPGDSLTPSSNQGVTSQHLADYQDAVNAFESLPIYIDDNGKPRFKPAFLSRVVEAERSDLAAKLGSAGANARSAKVGLDMLGDNQQRLEIGHFTGEYLHAANSLLNQGVALRQMGLESIRVGNTSVTLEEIRKALASGEATTMVKNLDDEQVPFNAVDFLSDAGAVAKLNEYIDAARNYSVNAPTIMTRLAGAVDVGYLYNTNMLTGEKTMNGSNWIQLLLATGGIITPIATMLYQSERERRATRKNQEYADRVRAEDREFQERLLKLQLASAETQASIAAESRNKAVATGSSRTSVTINSPTQSK